MEPIRSGRAPRRQPRKEQRKLHPADITAVVCALLCAVTLCMFGGSADASSADTSAVPAMKLEGEETVADTESARRSVWDMLTDAMAEMLGADD